jgi:transcriptional regulator with XRE-family HTH domain
LVDVTPDPDRIIPLLGVGGRIALARQNKGWKQRELSEHIGKSRGTIVQYEQGKIEPPLRQIELLARALDVAPEFLAFGRQGITGLHGDTSDVASIPEVKMEGDEQAVSGVYGLPQTLVTHLGLDPDQAQVIALDHNASAFGLAAGDRVILDTGDQLQHEDKLYALKTRRGIDVVRLLPNLSTRSDLVKLNDGSGENHSYERNELEVLGRVAGSIRAS